MTRKSRRPQSEAELEERFNAAIARMMEQPSTSEPSIAPEAPEATTKVIDRCWEAPTKATLAEAQEEQRLLAEIWASIAEPDWAPRCSHTEIINYHCLECGVNFC